MTWDLSVVRAHQEALWTMYELHAHQHFVRREEAQDYIQDSDFDWPRPAIYGDRWQHTYYLVEEIERRISPCPVCSKPIVGLRQGEGAVHVWFRWGYFGHKFGLTDRQVNKIQDSMPPKYRNYSSRVCSPVCEKQLRRSIEPIMYERIKQWARQKHEQEILKQVKSLNRKARKAMREKDLGALRSLRKEYAQAATSRYS